MDLYVPSKKFKTRPGLYFEDGTVKLDGEPFAEIGINYFGAVINEYYHSERGELKTVFDRLKENNIRYFRANIGFFYPVNLRDYINDEDKWFATFDKVVRTAEEYGFGMVFSFFWNTDGYNDYFHEPISAWGDKNSRTRKFMRYYTQKVVARYKESPAVWMWEFGNEQNLAMDLPNRKELREESKDKVPLQLGLAIQHEEDDFWFADIGTPLFEDFAKICHMFDPYDRMVTTGNSEPRPKAYGTRAYDMWREEPDSIPEMIKTLEWYTPDPMDCVEIHSYGIEDRWDHSIKDYLNYYRVFLAACEKLGKPLYIGEFNGLNSEESKKQMDAIVDLRVPLSCIWAIGQVEWSLDMKPEVRDEVLAYASKCNLKLRGEA